MSINSNASEESIAAGTSANKYANTLICLTKTEQITRAGIERSSKKAITKNDVTTTTPIFSIKGDALRKDGLVMKNNHSINTKRIPLKIIMKRLDNSKLIRLPEVFRPIDFVTEV